MLQIHYLFEIFFPQVYVAEKKPAVVSVCFCGEKLVATKE